MPDTTSAALIAYIDDAFGPFDTEDEAEEAFEGAAPHEQHPRDAEIASLKVRLEELEVRGSRGIRERARLDHENRALRTEIESLAEALTAAGSRLAGNEYKGEIGRAEHARALLARLKAEGLRRRLCAICGRAEYPHSEFHPFQASKPRATEKVESDPDEDDDLLHEWAAREAIKTINCPLVTGLRPCECDLPRCPLCNYTAHDAQFETDHSRCLGAIPAGALKAEG